MYQIVCKIIIYIPQIHPNAYGNNLSKARICKVLLLY